MLCFSHQICMLILLQLHVEIHPCQVPLMQLKIVMCLWFSFQYSSLVRYPIWCLASCFIFSEVSIRDSSFVRCPLLQWTLFFFRLPLHHFIPAEQGSYFASVFEGGCQPVLNCKPLNFMTSLHSSQWYFIMFQPNQFKIHKQTYVLHN